MNRRQRTQLSPLIEYLDRYPREYFIFAFFGLFSIAILWATFSYTVLQYSFYKAQADNQHIAETTAPVTRGNIYANAPHGSMSPSLLATSVSLSDVAIDPHVQGDKEKLIDFLTEIVYLETCSGQSTDACYRELLRFLRVLDIPEFVMQESFIKETISQRVRERVYRDKVTSVLIQTNISPEQEIIFQSLGLRGVYPTADGLYINPEELYEREVFVEKYIEVFGGEFDDILHRIRQRNLRFVPIVNRLSIRSYDMIQEYLAEERQALRLGVIDRDASIGRFFIFTPRPQRVYPEGSVASQIIGFMNHEGNGNYGIEGFFNDVLRGNPGELRMKKDVQGRPLDPLSIGQDIDNNLIRGADIYLTIDRNVQRRVEQILEEHTKKYRANTSSAIVMDPNTGRIIAMANYPTFDSNNPGDVYELKRIDYDEYPNPERDLLGKSVFVEDIANGEKFLFNGREIYLREALREEYGDRTLRKYIFRNDFGAGVYQNFAITNLYEPGSIQKGITVAIGIDTEEIRPFDTYDDVGRVTIDGFTIRNVSRECSGIVTFTHALNFSCNVGMIRIVQRVGRALFHKYLQDFGFDKPTGITLSGEIAATMEPAERWSQAKLLTNSYGLGISTTALQMATAYSAIANGGLFIPPYIVDRAVYPDGREISYQTRPERRILKESSADATREMLIRGIEIGAAHYAKVDGYYVAGKTGTSQIAYRGRYESGIGATNGSFAGFLPADNPQFVVVVRFERPRTTPWGANTAAPAFGDIGKYLMEYYGIPKNR
ncbi:penicillin-binding protein 2 [Candidatus Gracilibacteria bacterium]|nr:penicillin-binding protein 2 [Candidatus Gracilibacteria bacterium]